jgi:subtilisin family serine protease
MDRTKLVTTLVPGTDQTTAQNVAASLSSSLAGSGVSILFASKRKLVFEVAGDKIMETADAISAHPQIKWVEGQAEIKKRQLVETLVLRPDILPADVGRSVNSKDTPERRLNNWAAETLLFDGSFHLRDDLGLDGAGQIIGVSDSGLDHDSCFFYDEDVPTPTFVTSVFDKDPADAMNHNHRKILNYLRVDGHNDFEDDADGHGTHVCGSAAGNSLDFETGTYNGIALEAKLHFFDVGMPSGTLDVPYDLEEGLFPYGYQSGAKVHSNSW